VSTREPGDTGPAPGADENFLSRWSRRKAQARAEPREPEPTPTSVTATGPVAPAPASDAPAAGAPGRTGVEDAVTDAANVTAAPAIELPDIDSLGEDSDYSAFLTPGVDADLRRRALRKLFSSPKFNVFDGLDTYRDDFTEFPALGSVVTADMRYHVERLAQKVVEVLDEQTAPAPTPAAPVAAVSATTAPDAHCAPDAAAAGPPATTQQEDQHDIPA
jgi:hypothetical protein